MDFEANDLMMECKKCGGAGLIEFNPQRSGGTFGTNLIYKSPENCDACKANLASMPSLHPTA